MRTAGITTLVLLVVIFSGAGWIYYKLNKDINTFSDDGIAQDRPPDTSPGQNILILGSDSRSGDNSDFAGGAKENVGGSDTTLLMHVYADHKHAVAVSIPRDTLVTLPSCRQQDGTWTKPKNNVKINSAFEIGNFKDGNPACTQNTVEKLTGLRIDHTIVVNFAGFAAMTSAVDGVEVCMPKELYEGDLNPNLGHRGALIFPKGKQKVTGQKALDYVRIRHGIGDGSDIGRIKRQQAFIASLLKAIKVKGLSPTTLLPLAEAAAKSMTFDPGLNSVDKLLSFGLGLKDIDLHNIKFSTVPWRYQGEDVAIVQPDANAVWAAIREDRTLDNQDASGNNGQNPSASASPPAAPTTAPPTVNGSGIRVGVYNGTVTPGLAGRASDMLKAQGFTVTAAGTAKVQDQTTTLVEYAAGKAEQAKTVAAAFPGAQVRQTDGVTGIRVVLGADYAATGPKASGSPTAAAPTSVPPKVADDARSADEDVCADLSYG